MDAELVDLGWMEHCPLLAALRRHPQWKPLATRVGRAAGAILAAIDGKPAS